MTKDEIAICNLETGQFTQRLLNEAEIKQDQVNRNEAAFLESERQKLRMESIIAKSSILEKLGITADEAALLLS